MNSKYYSLHHLNSYPKCQEMRIVGECGDKAYYRIMRKGKKYGMKVCKEHLRDSDVVDTEFRYDGPLRDNRISKGSY